MKKIREEFLHYIWQYRFFHTDYLSYGEERVEVIDPGIHNFSSGPDFFNARVKIGGTMWAGNVEVHVKASDWLRHGHQHDNAYDSVVLHVVYDNDLAVYRTNGEEIPCVRLNFSPAVLNKYLALTDNRTSRICTGEIVNLDRIFVRDWTGKLLVERLEEKTSVTENILKENHYDWEDALYKTLAVAFGMKLNAEPFRLLASCIPLKFILKNRNNPLTVNAAFFGQAGFLDELITDDTYYGMLMREYSSVRELLPPALPRKHMWKFMRSRPAGFPTARIPQFMNLVCNAFPLFEKIISATQTADIRKLLSFNTKNYWVDHFLYGQRGRRKLSIPGRDTIDTLIINAIIPVLFLYGKFALREDLTGRALELLEELPAEMNEITKKWDTFGIRSLNAFDSQAVIHLETRYCAKQRCLGCLFGHKILHELYEKGS